MCCRFVNAIFSRSYPTKLHGGGRQNRQLSFVSCPDLHQALFRLRGVVGCFIMALIASARSLVNIRAGGGLYTISARGKRKDYGYEEGHGEKNEVRKENWWRKRNPQRKIGDWRKENDLHFQPMSFGPVGRTPDWCFENGDPGPLNKKQSQMRQEMLRLVNEVHKAATLVLKAKEFEKK